MTLSAVTLVSEGGAISLDGVEVSVIKWARSRCKIEVYKNVTSPETSRGVRPRRISWDVTFQCWTQAVECCISEVNYLIFAGMKIGAPPCSVITMSKPGPVIRLLLSASNFNVVFFRPALLRVLIPRNCWSPARRDRRRGFHAADILLLHILRLKCENSSEYGEKCTSGFSSLKCVNS